MGKEELQAIGADLGVNGDSKDQKKKKSESEGGVFWLDKNVKQMNVTESRKANLKLRKEYKAAVSRAEAAEKALEEKTAVVSTEQYGQMFGVVFDIISMRLGDHWKLNPGEKGLLGQSFAPVAEAFFPNIDDKYQALGVFSVVLYGVAGRKYQMHKKLIADGAIDIPKEDIKEVKQERATETGAVDPNKDNASQ